MNALHDACLDRFAHDLAAAARELLEAAWLWDRSRRMARVRAWGCVIVRAQHVVWVVEDWQRIGVQPEELDGRLPEAAALAAYLAVELVGLVRRGAPGAEYEHVCRRLRGLASRVTEGGER